MTGRGKRRRSLIAPPPAPLLLAYSLVKAPDVGWGARPAASAGSHSQELRWPQSSSTRCGCSTGTQLGAALGLAIFSALATERTTSQLKAGHTTVAQAVTEGFQLALLVGACFILGATALLARSKRQAAAVEEEPALELAA